MPIQLHITSSIISLVAILITTIVLIARHIFLSLLRVGSGGRRQTRSSKRCAEGENKTKYEEQKKRKKLKEQHQDKYRSHSDESATS